VTAKTATRAMAAHRFLLIVGTAMLAFGTARVASDASDIAGWVMAVGAGVVMYVADVCGSLERESEELWRSTPEHGDKTLNETRADVFGTRAPRLALIWLAVGCLCIAVGLVESAPQHDKCASVHQVTKTSATITLDDRCPKPH
jgi:branched-subunit amino acid permease